jgi:tRNA pseudouridine38-40 synthase
MPRVKLTLAYDGGDYVGWQVQSNGLAVQTVVERALEKLLGAPTPVQSAGRTDAGVHAEGQVVTLDTPRELPLRAYVQGLNSILPDDVAVVRAEVVPDAFDPRRWSHGKRYRYQISNRPTRSPLRRRTHWEFFNPLDMEAMRAGAVHLLGRHDFSAFRAADCQARHAVRAITRLDVETDAVDSLTITVEGTAFLKHMVRNLVGTLVEVGRGKRSPEWVAEVLASRNRKLAGVTAPAHGLTLMEVFYGLRELPPQVAKGVASEAPDPAAAPADAPTR